MEMKTYKTFQVSTFDNKQPFVTVSVPVEEGYMNGRNVFNSVISSLGLKKSSEEYFTLCKGLETPTQCFCLEDLIPADIHQVSLQKWCFDSKKELAVVENDEVAARLIFQQTQTCIQKGCLSVTKEQEAKLEEYCDPKFTLESQYIKLCQTLDGYNDYRFTGCVVCKSIHLQQDKISEESLVSMTIKKNGVDLVQGNNVYTFDWSDVKSWQHHPGENHVYLQIVLGAKDENTNSEYEIFVRTDRSHFMLDVIRAWVKQIQMSDPGSPRFFVHMIKTQSDGSTHWENPLFKYTRMK